MLTKSQINNYFENKVINRNSKGVLVEYLQYEILDSLFKNPEAYNLSFIGGTAIRLVYNNDRFSEDIDFDNFSLTSEAFEVLLKKVIKDMEFKGFILEYRIVEKNAWHCYIKFPEILYKNGISSNQQEKILIRIDSEKKDANYTPDVYLLNKFSIYRKINVAPINVLLAQKMITIMQRKREKGRDVYDLSYLLGYTNPNFNYIKHKTGMEAHDFMVALSKRIDELDLNYLAKDVQPFLFDPLSIDRVLSIKELIKQKVFT